MTTKCPQAATLGAILIAISTASLYSGTRDTVVHENEITTGPFKSDDHSLSAYRCPEWFRDAKFGIWSHWGPQAVPREGDWYARGMYEQTAYDRKSGARKGRNRQNAHHVATYGHPSTFGYKDIIPLWKAERWNPDELMALYHKVGARYFVSMAAHHDNFFLWDSKIHRWNSVNMGPKKDVVGLWQQAARKHGMKFGVSEHLGASFTWFQPSHRADEDGPMKGVPYDGANPEFQDLYHKPAAPDDKGWLTTNPEYHRLWFERVKELVDLYEPDLLYSDSPMPFGDVGRSLIAHYYNRSAAANGGAVNAVYNCKQDAQGKWVRDIERGVAEGIRPEPWQTDTSIGDWYYRRGQKYMTSGEVIRMLVDIVSKNGNLLLNVVQTPEGDLEPDVLAILDGIASWMAVHGEAIYGTRPWKVHGEGPSLAGDAEKGRFGGLKDVPSKPFTGDDFRFTVSKDGRTLHAFCLGTPDKEYRIRSLGNGTHGVSKVEMLGCTEPLSWSQNAQALVIGKPTVLPSREAVCFRISLDN